MMFKQHISAVLLCSAAFSPLTSFAQMASDDQSVVLYEKEYFIKYEPVTLLDMLQRIPGVQAIIDNSKNGPNSGGTSQGGQQERGFGSGGDQILIDNKRLSGKANNISSTLQRISASQVERVEIIRGASGDLDVQSQGLVVNIIMDKGASTSNTFWKIGGRLSEGYVFSPDILVSHNGSRGNFDYILGVEAKQGQHIEHRIDNIFTPERVFTGSTGRNADNINKYLRFNTNVTYNGENGDEFRINGQFEPGKYTKREPRFSQSLNQPKEFTNWGVEQTSQKWEIGGDYTKRIDGVGVWKTLFIANRNRKEKEALFENIFDGGNVPVFKNNQYRVKQEKILRTSLTTGLTTSQSIEFGGEVAINKFDKVFTNETRVADVYVVSVNDDVGVKENRFEIFANHTYNISSKLVLQSSLTGEFSKISSITVPLSGANIERSKKFGFLKPRVDLRYDLTGNDQFRASIERKVSQLDFQNFVATYDAENDILRLGNTSIVPEKSWNYSLTYEHRLPNDAGALQVELFYRDIKDYIELVDFTIFEDGAGISIANEDLILISKSGNIPTARSYGIKTTGNLRLGFVGIPEAVISIGHIWDDMEVIDQFSGVKRKFKWLNEHVVTFNFRHDVTDWGFSYGVKGTIKSDSYRHEIDQVASSYNGDSYEIFAELKIFNDLKLIAKFEHITPLKYTTDMKYYNGHIKFNDIDHLEERSWRYVREWSLFLQGTF